MTAAEFIAACFWPFIVIAAFVLRKIRNTAAFPLAVNIVIVAAAAYVVLGAVYDKSSIIAVNDIHVVFVVMGLAMAGSQLRQPPLYGSFLDKAKALGWMILIVLLDHLTSRLVIEGRVDRAWRSTGRSRADYLVRIAGQSVKVTEPLYERLDKFRPRVRVELGRGSNYVYEIEYLSN
jgi:hypothetical protein